MIKQKEREREKENRWGGVRKTQIEGREESEKSIYIKSREQVEENWCIEKENRSRQKREMGKSVRGFGIQRKKKNYFLLPQLKVHKNVTDRLVKQ